MDFAEFKNRLEVYCHHLDTTPEIVFSESRTRAAARPRQVLMYLAHKEAGASYSELGRYFGGRDHTTVMHACRNVPKNLWDLYQHLLLAHKKAEARTKTQKLLNDWKQKRNRVLANSPHIKLKTVHKPIKLPRGNRSYQYTWHSPKEQAQRMMAEGILSRQTIQRLTGVRI